MLLRLCSLARYQPIGANPYSAVYYAGKASATVCRFDEPSAVSESVASHGGRTDDDEMRGK